MADSERNEQVSSAAGLPKCVIPFLPLGVAYIASNDQGFIEKHIFGFLRCDSMSFPVLVGVGLIPFKTGTGIEWVFVFRHID